MINVKMDKLGKKSIIISSLIVIFLFISSATAVPQTQGALIVEKIDNFEKIELFINKMKDRNNQIDFDEISNDIIDIETIIGDDNTLLIKIKNCINSLTNGIGNLGLVQKLLSILIILMIVPILMFTGATIGLSGLIIGFIRVIGKLVKIMLTIFAGLQSGLTISAFVVIFIGIISKFVIKLFSIIGAPISAIITSILTVLTGSLLGNISLVLSSIIALLLIFAIPLIIAGAVLLLYYLNSQEEPDADPPESSLFIDVIYTSFNALLKIPGTENILHVIWILIGNHYDILPDWPF